MWRRLFESLHVCGMQYQKLRVWWRRLRQSSKRRHTCNRRYVMLSLFFCLFSINQRMTKRRYAAVKVKRTKNRGFGLVLKTAVNSDDLIVEYCGEILTEEQMDERLADDK